MPAIGVPLRKWTLFLLVCSIPTCAYSHSTDDAATVTLDATATSSTTAQHASSSVTPPSSRSPLRAYTKSDPTCPFRTINYITHTLPQQCAKTSWSAPGEVAPTSVTATEADATQSSPPAQSRHGEQVTPEEEANAAATTGPSIKESVLADGTLASGTIDGQPEVELETDSPLDNANFLSFEDWKKRNLAQVGQSPENVGQGRAAPSNQPARRRPVNVNALDSLGDEAEIELDFSGFGTPPEGHDSGDAQARRPEGGTSTAPDGDKKAAPSSWALSKDAGKTCKERFNYASFDCAATVLKTNKQAKSATSVLVENKDSYMLNVCSADNKFFIVELCDDILVDTVVLANYEFFSSMFRHFRISVSDRYPVKLERWRTLATFEARNSREIQPFLITEPQIWARYLRVEFLTHYGNEFYCPMSLLRVHGTTMMEQFRREEEESRGVDDDVDLEVTEADIVKPAIDSGPIPPDEVPIPLRDDINKPDTPVTDAAPEPTMSSVTPAESNSTEKQASTSETSPSSTPVSPNHSNETSESNKTSHATKGSSVMSQVPIESDPSHLSGHAALPSSPETSKTTASVDKNSPAGTPSTAPEPAKNTSAPVNSQSKSVSNQDVNDNVPAKGRVSKGASNNTASSVQSPHQQRSSGTQPSPPAPSTQESFFKSIHKRLLYLEANSTLSLQYIEEQSRILRDAFVKVEKRQLAKTEKFLDHLNSTVMQELKSFRTMYDQLWQSTVIEIESMKERQKSEMSEIGTRLSLMADELVWQKRMAVVQSTLLLLCLGLVLFVRSGTLGSTADVPIVQQLGNKYSSFFESSPPRSPPESGIAKRRRTFKEMWRSDTSVGLSDQHSDGQNVVSDAETEGARSPVQIEYSPPTPETPGALAQRDLRNGINLTNSIANRNAADDEDEDEDEDDDDTYTSSPVLPPNTLTPREDDQAKRLEVLETQSGPATPNGTRDSRPSWEEVDRAMDQLKAEEEGGKPKPQSSSTSASASASASSSSTSSRRDRERNKKRSPLRRSYSSYDDTEEDSNGPQDSGNELFL